MNPPLPMQNQPTQDMPPEHPSVAPLEASLMQREKHHLTVSTQLEALMSESIKTRKAIADGVSAIVAAIERMSPQGESSAENMTETSEEPTQKP